MCILDRTVKKGKTHMTVHIIGSTVANAPKEVVWDILSDYGNIADYTGQVKTSEIQGDQATGIGAVRTCELAPFGSTLETVTGWEEGESITLDVVPKGMPVKSSHTTFTVKAVDDGKTEITMDTFAEPKGGIFKGSISKRLEKGLPKALDALISDLANAAEERVGSAG